MGLSCWAPPGTLRLRRLIDANNLGYKVYVLESTGESARNSDISAVAELIQSVSLPFYRLPMPFLLRTSGLQAV